MLLIVSWIICEFLNWQPAQQEIGKRGIWSHWLPSFPNIRGLPDNVQTLAWNSKYYHRDWGFHFRLSPIPSPSSISVLIISPCRLTFSQINQLPHFQARNRSAHLVVAHLRAFAQLFCSLKIPSLTYPALPLEWTLGGNGARVLHFVRLSYFAYSKYPQKNLWSKLK